MGHADRQRCSESPTHQSLPKSFNKCEFPWFSLYLYIYILDRTWQPSTSLALLLEPLLWPMHSTLLFLIVSCLEVSLGDLISNIQNLNAPIVCKWLIYYYYYLKQPGSSPKTVKDEVWWEETDRKAKVWPRTAGPPVALNPITRRSEAWSLVILSGHHCYVYFQINVHGGFPSCVGPPLYEITIFGLFGFHEISSPWTTVLLCHVRCSGESWLIEYLGIPYFVSFSLVLFSMVED